MRFARPIIYPAAPVLFGLVLIASACDTGVNDAASTDPPPAPVLRSPSDQSSGELNAVSLIWDESPGASSYQLQVSREANLGTLDLERGTVLQTRYDVRGLELSTPYYWRVRAVNEMGVGDWSEVWLFAASEEARFPSVPRLELPQDRAENQPTEIEFKWNATANATAYHLEVALDADFFSTIASIDGIPATSKFVFGLVKSYTYYWRVRAYNPAGYSSWSGTRYIVVYGREGEID